MMEAKVEAKDLEKLIRKLDGSPEVIRKARQKALADAAPKLKQAVDEAIGGTGKVQSWQDHYLGTRGGYAAARPKKETYTQTNGRGKRYAVGHVTNAIDSGHKFPTPSSTARRYKAKIKSARMKVPGRHFYRQAEGAVPGIAREAAEQIRQSLLEHLKE